MLTKVSRKKLRDIIRKLKKNLTLEPEEHQIVDEIIELRE